MLSIILNSAEGPSDILVFFGRIHPLVVHFPIGLLLLAALVEISTRWSKFSPLKNYTHYLWALGSVSAFFAVILGYFLSLSGDYNAETVFWHKWTGVAVFLFSIICYYISRKQLKLPFYGKSILISIIVFSVFYTGHLGGNLTHGSTYLLEYAPNGLRKLAGMPKKAIPRKKVTVLDSADIYLDLISPMMDNRCVSCHNKDKKKGDLDLTTFSNLMAGGENGEIVIPGDPNSSDIYRRITLPESHDDFMPSEGKPPLSSEEITLIGWWIKMKAPSEGYFLSLNPDKEMKDKVEKYLGLDKNKLLSQEVQAPKKKIIDSLNSYGFILNQLMKGNYFLEANFTLSERGISDSGVETLLQLKDQLIWLNMGNSNITDDNLEKIGLLENLIKLNLSKNKISDKGLIHLSKLENLESLNLYKTNVSESLLVVIPKLINLKRLYLSESNASKEIVGQLQKENKNLKIVFQQKD